MKRKIIVPLEIELWIDENVIAGKITNVVVKKRVLSQEEINKMVEELE